MNAEDQRVRHLAIERVNRRVDDLAAAVDDEVRERVQEIRELIARLFTAEHTERLSVERGLELREIEARKTLDAQAMTLYSLGLRVTSFQKLSFWDRVRWFVLGRVPTSEDPIAQTAQHAETSQLDPRI